MNRAIAQLDWAIAEKFCLHGSPVMGLTHIEPRQAICRGNHPDNCQLAVYADPHDSRRPLIHATVMKLCGEKSSTHGYHGEGAGLLIVTGTNVTFGFGSVYILPRHTFFFRGDEYISYHRVGVVAEVIVSPRTILAIRHDYDLHVTVPPPW